MSAPEPASDILEACETAGKRYRKHAVQAAASAYERERHLARIVPVSRHIIADTSISGTEHIVKKLEETARGLGKAARERHWTYDTNRHIAVLGALHAERAALIELEAQQGRKE